MVRSFYRIGRRQSPGMNPASDGLRHVTGILSCDDAKTKVMVKTDIIADYNLLFLDSRENDIEKPAEIISPKLSAGLHYKRRAVLSPGITKSEIPSFVR